MPDRICLMIEIESVETFVYRYPLETPVKTSFGTMTDRPMVIVKLVDKHGLSGFGEIWCNFPAVGAEHRARLVESVFRPLVISKNYANPKEAFNQLTRETWVLGLQTGEFGPLAQCIAGIDIAFNDLQARKVSQPLWKFLGGTDGQVAVYASGINPKGAERTAELALKLGFTALKLKIGFGDALDLQNIKSICALLGKDEQLMVDANQAWTAQHARRMMNKMANYQLGWLEEPILADRPDEEWFGLAEVGGTSLAAGENIFDEDRFEHILSTGFLHVVQPDLAKWGGISKTVPLARKIIGCGRRYCPHFLGGGIGLLASAHVLAAVGGDGMLEVDFNPNPLRSKMVDHLFDISSGSVNLGNLPGLGIEPDFGLIEEHRVR